MEIETLFCNIDDFCQEFEKIFKPQALTEKIKKRNRQFKLSVSEIVTIIINFHSSSYRNFKDYYTKDFIIPYLSPNP